MEHEEENRSKIWKEFVLMRARTATMKPRVEHMDLNYSNLSANREREERREEEEDREGKGI